MMSPPDNRFPGKSPSSSPVTAISDQFLRHSFDQNQSCPLSGRTRKSKATLLRGTSKFCGDEVRSYSYTKYAASCDLDSSLNSPPSNLSSSRLNASWSFASHVGAGDATTSSVQCAAVGKALVTFDPCSSQILTASRYACELFGYPRLAGVRMTELFKRPVATSKRAAIMHDVNRARGDMVVLAGKVLDAVTANGKALAVSVWLKRMEQASSAPRCVAVIEPVARVVGNFDFDANGDVLCCDENFALICGLPSSCELEGVNLSKLMTSFLIPEDGKLPKEVRKQHVTGTNGDSITSFPLTVRVHERRRRAAGRGGGEWEYSASAYHLATIGGLLSFDSLTGHVTAVNSNFSSALLGYTNHQLKRMNIADLLPHIVVSSRDSSLAGSYSSLTGSHSSVAGNAVKKLDIAGDEIMNKITCSVEEVPESNISSRFDTCEILSLADHRCDDDEPSHCDEDDDATASLRTVDDSWTEISVRPRSPRAHVKIDSVADGHSTGTVSPPSSLPSEGGRSPAPSPRCGVALAPGTSTSTPLGAAASPTSSRRRRRRYKEGVSEGRIRHKDSSWIPVTCDVRPPATDGADCFVWVRFEADDARFNFNTSFNSTLASTSLDASHLDQSLGAAIRKLAIGDSPRRDDDVIAVTSPVARERGASRTTDDEEAATRGEFGRKYEVCGEMGSGAFGFVRLARHRRTRHEVVVKFILKSKIPEEYLVDDYESDSLIPLEISLLLSLEHANVVHALEFFENSRFYSVVMTRHGARGCDLFEFIDREPRMDEALASFLFRQIAAGIRYLHHKGIVHRDIKDENVIVDENFHCKLIDFGSAAYFRPGRTFDTFCGTVEYCSPEVLLGNQYEGPQLEVWALGVTLYTLVYGENPFQDVEETIEAVLKPPSILSRDLMHLMRWMLHPSPGERSTIDDVMLHSWPNIYVDPSAYSWDEVAPEQPSSTRAAEDDERASGKERAVPPLNLQHPSSDDDDENCAHQAAADRDGKHVRDFPAPANGFPLTRRLENQLNHSI